jgi:hypothetical protein
MELHFMEWEWSSILKIEWSWSGVSVEVCGVVAHGVGMGVD